LSRVRISWLKDFLCLFGLPMQIVEEYFETRSVRSTRYNWTLCELYWCKESLNNWGTIRLLLIWYELV
jgi:hypothetical protein